MHLGAAEKGLLGVRRVTSLVLVSYHRVLSPWLPNACRFYPSCSLYAAQAVERHGVIKGVWLGVRRLSRCNPLRPGGYDPVP
jgi:putative membrane protein insertion efficiency factor